MTISYRLFLKAGLILSLLLFVFQVSPAFAQTAQTLDAGAKVHVTVAGEPDVSGDYTVDSSGSITLLYVNQVPVAGLSPAQASQKLASKDFLGKYYKNPQVVVTLLSAGGINIEVDGAVATQGVRLVRTDARLNDVLQQSGPALDADLSGVKITHGTPGQTHTTDSVDYLSFLNSQADAGNPQLKDGDVIFVPRKENVQILINVRGEVVKPGRVSVPANTTAYDAIQAAGGLTLPADRKGIAIQHANMTDKVTLDYDAAMRDPTSVQANPVLLDGDTVVVAAAATPNVFTLTGAVRQPGEYDLTTPNYSLATAIGKAGGLADRAKLKEVTITRTPPGGKVQTIKLDATDPTVQASTLVQPGDNITIPQGSPSHSPDPISVIGVLASVFSIFGRR